MTPRQVLIAGEWRDGGGEQSFKSIDPASGAEVGTFPISDWSDIDEALGAGCEIFPALRDTPPERIAGFLHKYADLIEERSDSIVEVAHRETALPRFPRLADVELPRTTDQLRQAARAAESRSWVEPTLSPTAGIASWMAPIPGVACVFGPNNFPLAFNGISGGDFAAAVATRHPVIAKANPGHPETTSLLATAARDALDDTGLPPATVQLLYRTTHADGARMVSDDRVAATGYTGSRTGGLALKAAADAGGRPIYLEMSSVNPVIVLPGAVSSRPEEIAEELAGSLLLGCGQFCTSPGLTFVVDDTATQGFLDALASRVTSAPSGTLLDHDMPAKLETVRSAWENAGASTIGAAEAGTGASFPNTVMTVAGERFLADPETLQQEAFGNLGLVVVASSFEELLSCLGQLESNLTGTIYTAGDEDEQLYQEVSPILRDRVGRLLNNKMPTGVAVVSAMNHGGPYPATGHPGFTAVGIPASLRRFAMLQSFDNVPDHHLPEELQAANPLGLQRLVDGSWTTASVTWGK